MNYLQLCQRVRKETGVAGTGPVGVDSTKTQEEKIIAWVQQADTDIINLWADWDFLWKSTTLPTVASQRDYTLAADFRLISEDSVMLVLAGGQRLPLDYVYYGDYRQRQDVVSSEGSPYEYTMLPNNKMRLLPTPDGVYTIEYDYWCRPALLTVNTSNSLIPEAHQDTIVWKAVMFWAGYNEAEAEYQKAVAKYLQSLKHLENAYLPMKNKANSRREGADIVVEAS